MKPLAANRRELIILNQIGFNIDHGGLHYNEVMAISKSAEELCFDSIAFPDHLASSFGSADETFLETWSLFPPIALNLTKIKFASLVTNNLFRHPGVLAKMAATVDNLSKGRLIFGIGAGWNEREAVDFGYAFPDFRTRIEMLDEAIQVIRSLWQDNETTFEGKHYSLHSAESLPKPFQKPHPPILVGGKAKGILHLMARYADISNFTLRNLGLDGCKKKLETLRDFCIAEENNGGRSYDSILKTISGPCFFADNERELEEELELESKRQRADKEELRKYYLFSSIFGTVDQVVEQIRQFERIGIDGVFFRFQKSKQVEKAKTFSEQIIPKIRN